METTTLMMTRTKAAAERAEKAAAKLFARAEKAAAKEAAKEAKLFAWAAKAEAKAEAKAAKAAAKEAKEVARPTPYDGLHLLDGTLYMVDEKTGNVFDYDVATETVGDRVGVWVDGIIEYAEPLSVEPLSAVMPGTVVATVVEPPVEPVPVPAAKAPAPVARAKTAASAVKRAATKEAKAVILRAQIARLEEQLARRQAELAAL